MKTKKTEKQPLEFKNVKSDGGLYRLCVQLANGHLVPVDGIGMSVKPFEIAGTWNRTPFMVVRKFGTRRTEKNTKPRGALFMVNKFTGQMPAEFSPNGAARVMFDEKTLSFYYVPYTPQYREPNFFCCILPNQTQYQTVVVPIHAHRVYANPVRGSNVEIIPVAANDVRVHGKKQLRRVTTDWTQSSDNTLRSMYYYYRKKDGVISDALNAELARRFPSYNAGGQAFERQTAAETQPRATQVAKDWGKRSNSALRQAFYFYKKRGRAIPDGLNAELVQRFPTYSADTQTFGNNMVTKRKRSLNPNKQWDQCKDMSLRRAYSFYKKQGRALPDGLHAELTRRFPGYNPETQTFNKTVIRKDDGRRDWTRATDKTLRIMHYYYNKRGNGIPDELNAELGRRFAGYDMTTHTFGNKRARATTAKAPQTNPAQPTVVTRAAPSKPVASVKQPTVERDAGKKSETPVVAPVRPVVPERVAAKPVDAAPVLKPAVVQKTAQPKPAARPTIELSVTLKPVKMTLQGTYNDVYINGKRVLHNHIDTELKTFLGGTILGVHGIVTDDPGLPARPVWMVYNTDLVPNKWVGKDKFSGYNVYVSKIGEGADVLRLFASNRAQILLELEKYQKLAAGRIFAIKEEKTK